MILHLKDVLLQSSMDTLYPINCLYIITNVHCGKKCLDNFSHNSAWVHVKVQNCEGRVSGNRDCFLPLSVSICLSAPASEATVRSMPKKWSCELSIRQTFRISLA